MSSIRVLKRKSVQRQNNFFNIDRKLLRRSFSSGDLNESPTANLRRTKSDSNFTRKDCKASSINIVQPAKSERNIDSIYNYVTSLGTTHSNLMDESSYSVIHDNNNESIKIPIIGYEVMEERSRFTIFKLRIENYEKNSFWLVLRRFTDFARLHVKLKQLYPNVNLVLPKKKWFGNNFSAGFLDTRVAGLQTFINTVLSNADMRKCPVVREFFCLDEPPLFSESMEDCKAIFEAQEETIAYLKIQLKAKDEIITNLTNKNEYLTSLVSK